MTIYAAIVGTGFAARKRAEALRKIPQVQLIAVASRSLERAQAFGAEHQVVAVSIEALWQIQQLDLVFVGTVNASHGVLVQQALEQQKHVVVEYPLALTVAEATQLIALARKRQRLLHVEQIGRAHV